MAAASTLQVTLTEKLFARVGKTLADVPTNSRLGRAIQADGVSSGAEFRRIDGLPRRKWEDIPAETIDALTEYFRIPGGTQRLRPMQAAALLELHDFGIGQLDFASVGSGKTLVTALAPTALELEPALLLTDATLIDKTKREFGSLAADWRVYPRYEMKSYTMLSRKSHADYLLTLRPRLIVADESHAFQNPRSGLTLRVLEYLKGNPECRFVALTGTPGDESIEQVAHVAAAALGARSPYPRDFFERRQWALALDVGTDDMARIGPGALTKWADGDGLDAVRAGVGRRVAETPGVIVNRKAGEVSSSLYLKGWVFDAYSEATEAAFRAARETWTAPDGRELEEAADAAGLFRSLALGYYRVVDPEPPREWRDARRAWNAFVRYDLQHNRSRRMTAEQVLDACAAGLDSGGAYEAWLAIKPTFRYVPKIEWFDLSALEAVAVWLKKERQIVWTPSPDVGYKLKEMTGVSFFHSHGEDRDAGSIETYPGGPAILSVKANMKGRNLQDRWNKCLVLGPYKSGTIHEQMLGRLHRFGQKAPAVEATYFLGCLENATALEVARARQQSDANLNSNLAAKLLIGDWLLPSLGELQKKRSCRWHT